MTTKEEIKKLEKQHDKEEIKITKDDNKRYDETKKRQEKNRKLGYKIQELKDNLNGGRDTIKFSKAVTITKNSFDTLGGGVSFETPKDCDLIILCGNKGGGLSPYRCLLPHQVYVKDLKKTFKETGFEVITMIPVKSDTSIDLAYNGMYGEQRWREK